MNICRRGSLPNVRNDYRCSSRSTFEGSPSGCKRKRGEQLGQTLSDRPRHTRPSALWFALMLRSLARQWILPFIDPRQLASVRWLPRYLSEWRRFCRISDSPARFTDLWPCLGDRVRRTPFDPHYFHQAAWLARLLAQSRPAIHIDIGSSVTAVGVL